MLKLRMVWARSAATPPTVTAAAQGYYVVKACSWTPEASAYEYRHATESVTSSPCDACDCSPLVTEQFAASRGRLCVLTRTWVLSWAPHSEMNPLAGSTLSILENGGALALVLDHVDEDDALCTALACTTLRDVIFAR